MNDRNDRIDREHAHDSHAHETHGDQGHNEHGHSHDEHSHSTDDHGHSHDHRSQSTRALTLALAINTAFFFVEIGGAYWAGSLTLFADAVHMLTDSASLGLALFAAWVSTRPPDAQRTYGYHRAEVLGALANGVFLVCVVGYILYDAAVRVQHPSPVDAPIVIVVGVVGLVANVAAAWTLADHRGSLNVEGAFVHLVADAAGSVAAIALGVALVFTDATWLDPVFAVLIAALVLYSAKDLLAESLNILLQGTPRSVDVDELAAALCEIEGVASAHDVHAWALDSERTAVSAHVVVDTTVDSDTVLGRARSLLAARFGVDHATIQVESGDRLRSESFDCYSADASDP